MKPANPVSSLYVHVPFCARKCDYCAFFSELAAGNIMEQYVTALIRELEIISENLTPKTIYFGGGTPTLLPIREWERILKAMERLNLLKAEEWTVECNPASLAPDKAGLLKEYGVNRISMGMQSLDDDLLDRLGRVHDRRQAFKSYDILRAAGFGNINLDLMFAIPTQTLEEWDRTLTEAFAMRPEHLSSYEVTYEEDTPLFEEMRAGKIDVDENLICAMYDVMVERCQNAGLMQYEISNFGRHDASAFEEHPKRACRHNVNYWRGGDYYGAGPSASSYVRGVRSKNWSNTKLYCERLSKGERAIESSEELSPLARAGELAAFGLRMNCGWDFEQFRKITGFDLRDRWAREMQQIVEIGCGHADDKRFYLNAKGLRLEDWVAEQFIVIEP